jgi:hypothetical protein
MISKFPATQKNCQNVILLHEAIPLSYVFIHLRTGNWNRRNFFLRLLEPESKHRRIDIIVVPWRERACALLYFTGSAIFNRSE